MTTAQGWVALGILLAFIGLIITLLVGMIASLRTEFRVIAEGVGERIDRLQDVLSIRIDSVQGRLGARLDSVEGQLSARIDSVEDRLTTRIDSVEARLTTHIDSLDAGQAQLTARFDRLAESVQRLDRDLQARPG